MDRGKSSSGGRGGKSKAPQHPWEVYALGAKAGNEPTKRSVPVPHSKPGTSHTLSGDRKREGVVPPSALLPPKKAKLAHSSTVVSGGIVRSSSVPSQDNSDAWENYALDFDPADFITLISDASTANDHDKVVGYICGAIKTLKQQRFKPDASLIQSLIYLSKIKSLVFTNEYIMSALCSVLRRDPNLAFKTKSPVLPVLATNLLMRAYQDSRRWPDVFVKLYIEDSLGERLWVDQENCKGFVDNVLTAFSTKAVPAESRPELADDPESIALTGPSSTIAKEILEFIPVINRFSMNQDSVEATVLEIVKENLNRRQAPDNITRNFLKLLASAAGLVEVRMMSATRLEVWLQNPKLLRSAQELLMAVCVNCTGHTQKDVEVISALVKIRLKSKVVVNYYLACIRELIIAHSDNLATVLKHTIYNELSQSRNPNNLAMLSVMFQYEADTAATILADIFQELLLNRDDYLRPLRALLREIWRTLRSDLNLAVFSRGLMSQTEPLPRDCEFSQRAFTATADLITLCMFLATATYARPDKKEPPPTCEKMQSLVAGIQNDAVWWLQETALRIYRPSPTDFVHALHKVVLMEQPDQYYKLDNWPPETDRMQFMRLASEVPLQQHILLRVLMMGLSKEHPLSPPDTLELADQLVRRAANIPTSDNVNMLTVDKLEIFDLVFNLCAYHHPENIDLPVGYTPPTLAITNLYWKGWALLLVLAAHNPTTIGAVGWNNYPTLRLLMEMCITNHFVFPAAPDELQVLALEKEAILQFETHLAAASTKVEINEQSSLLLSQLTGMDVKGDARRPPAVVVEQLTLLNNQLRLGHQLCRCRQPDFLLDIIQHQGPSQSMPWLADLVHSSDASLSHLPVQCLCEFLLSSSARQQHKYQQLLSHLQSLLNEPSQDPEIVCEILDYFLRRLSSPRNREQAIAGLRLVLGCAEDEVEEGKDDTSWLLKQLPLLPHFPEARPQIVIALRSACLVETDPGLVVTYLNFLAQHTSSDVTETTDLVADMATLIVERSTIINAIIPSQDHPNAGLDAFLSIFYTYLIKAREPQREAYAWSESQDQILVTWPSGEQCTLYILVVHAMVIILAFGPQCVSLAAEYQHLLDMWFPLDKQDTPKAFLVDTSEEALLIPDWLKLRMIRSRVPRLVDAALTDLEPQQLILFIQSFGIPVASMSKLLDTLDRAALTDEVSVVEAVQDKGYMIQLVEVQHQRGAEGGEIFARALGVQDTPRSTEPDLEDITPMDVSEPMPLDLPPTTQLTDNKAVVIVERLFLMPESLSDRQTTRELFMTLQKTLSSEVSKSQTSKEPPRILTALIIYLMKKTSSDKSFVRAVVSRAHIACSLFRLLTSVTRSDLLSSVLLIASVVLPEAQRSMKAKPLVGILKSLIQKHQNKEMTFRAQSGTDNPKKVFEETSLSRLEVQGRLLLEAHSQGGNDSKTLVQALSSVLLKQSSDNRKGLLLDWLVQLEPEIIGETSSSQMDLLFSRGEFVCRPFLLTLLTHHASWATLHHCTKRLLSPKAGAKYDPTAVLDFLIALTCNPKLLQGREKYTPKHGAVEDILNLPRSQLPCIADYIVEEAVRFDDIKEAVDKMNLRLSLLAPHADQETLSIVVKHLNENAAKPTGKHSEMCRQLLVQLYLRVPSIVTQLSDTELAKYLSNSSISVMGSSVLDTVSHTLLTALTATPPNKDWYRRSQEFDLATRKMTATHPLLVLRQLEMIAAALRGRVHLEFPVLRSRNHLALFTQVLGLLELLRPHLFRAEYTTPLHNIFDTYFALFKQHGHMKDVGALLVRFVSLLKAYIGHNAEESLRYLQTQAALISELQTQHHSLGSVCILVAGVRGAGAGEVVVTVPPAPPGQDTFPPQWDHVIASLKGPEAGAGEVVVTVPPAPPGQDTFPPQWDHVIASLKGPAGVREAGAGEVVVTAPPAPPGQDTFPPQWEMVTK
ncbi:integrator complex subunit 1-like [Macrosteles quadrilineatus]|uniref:integrator complex subunit 1-like n=1 Tax=Macrosteles quadrilineatus TaxID=74068 RepID=UPI0023E09DBF|nr:integrator complex subunit 1-like [Macrosteles quadrilineatus]